jgi:molybdopterin-guanine dinucleotide biosynthesis protein A
VLRDRIPDFAGPLAGLRAGIEQARSELVIAVPCDAPLLPANLVARLLEALESADADAAVARTEQRVHSVICLCRASLLDHLAAFMDRGGRKVSDWHASLNVVYVDFDEAPERFRNINTVEDLRSLEAFVRG